VSFLSRLLDATGMISARTKAALKPQTSAALCWAAIVAEASLPRSARLAWSLGKSKQRGGLLAPIVKELPAAGATLLRAIAAGLNDRNIPTARGGEWSATQVARLLEDIERPFDVAA
jgi:hypothetical protein